MCPYRHDGKCNRGCRGFQCRHRGEMQSTNVVGPAHLAPAAAPGLAFDARGVLAPIARESVDDALLIVESYGPWGADLNTSHRLQIVLADEVKRLRAAAPAMAERPEGHDEYAQGFLAGRLCEAEDRKHLIHPRTPDVKFPGGGGLTQCDMHDDESS